MWIDACLERGDCSVLCPEPGCGAVMLRSDVGRIAGEEAKLKLIANQARDFRGQCLAEFETVVDTAVEAAFFGGDYIAGCTALQLNKKDSTRRAALKILQVGVPVHSGGETRDRWRHFVQALCEIWCYAYGNV